MPVTPHTAQDMKDPVYSGVHAVQIFFISSSERISHIVPLTELVLPFEQTEHLGLLSIRKQCLPLFLLNLSKQLAISMTNNYTME